MCRSGPTPREGCQRLPGKDFFSSAAAHQQLHSGQKLSRCLLRHHPQAAKTVAGRAQTGRASGDASDRQRAADSGASRGGKEVDTNPARVRERRAQAKSCQARLEAPPRPSSPALRVKGERRDAGWGRGTETVQPPPAVPRGRVTLESVSSSGQRPARTRPDAEGAPSRRRGAADSSGARRCCAASAPKHARRVSARPPPMSTAHVSLPGRHVPRGAPPCRPGAAAFH